MLFQKWDRFRRPIAGFMSCLMLLGTLSGFSSFEVSADGEDNLLSSTVSAGDVSGGDYYDDQRSGWSDYDGILYKDGEPSTRAIVKVMYSDISLGEGTFYIDGQEYKIGAKAGESNKETDTLAPRIWLKSLRNGQNITLTIGPSIKYRDVGLNSSWGTCIFTVSSDGETQIAYCVEPQLSTPAGGSGKEAWDYEGGALLKKILYYGYGGPDDRSSEIFRNSDPNTRYVYTHIAAAYAYMGVGAGDAMYGSGMTWEELDENWMGDAIRAFNGLSVEEAYASNTNLEGTLKDGKLCTDWVQLSGNSLTLSDGLMLEDQNGNCWGSVTVEGLSGLGNVRFVRNVDSVSGVMNEAVTIYGAEDVHQYVIKSDGAQDVAYIYALGNSETLNLTWRGYTYYETKLLLRKNAGSLMGVSGTNGNYVFQYNNTPFAGAEYGLYAKNTFTDSTGQIHYADELLSSGTTGNSGAMVFPSIPTGASPANGYAADYYIREIAYPAGMGVTGDTATRYDVHFYFDTVGGEHWSGSVISENQAVVTNTRQKASVSILKVNSADYSKPVSGAGYTLYNKEAIKDSSGTVLLAAGSAIQTAITGADGKAVFNADLPYGYTYYIKETSLPEGYAINNEIREFTFKTNSAENMIYYVFLGEDAFHDEEQRAKLTVTKQGESLKTVTGEGISRDFVYVDTPLDGFEFEVVAKNSVTDKTGNKSYSAGEKVAFLTTGDISQSFSYVDDRTPLTFSSLDRGEITVSGLLPGTYLICETGGPKGYVIGGEKEITISGDQSGANFVLGNAGFYNERQKAAVTIRKVNEENAACPVEGAAYTLFAAEDIRNAAGDTVLQKDSPIQTVLTGADGKAEFTADLPYGYRFYIQETASPAGYVLSTDRRNFVFTTDAVDRQIRFDFTGEADVYSDREQLAVLTVGKHGDILTNTEGEQGGIFFRYEESPLNGFTFEVLAKGEITNLAGTKKYTDGEKIAAVTTGNLPEGISYVDDRTKLVFSSSGAGRVTIKGLLPGTYVIKEVSGLDGYVVDGEKEVTIAVNDSGEEFVSSEVEFFNERQKAKVLTWKKDKDTFGDAPEDPDYLEGTVFTLYSGEEITDFYGNMLLQKDIPIESVATNQQGKAEFTADLPYGFCYYVKETKARGGYILNTDDFIYEFAFRVEDTISPLFVFPGESAKEINTAANTRVEGKFRLEKVDSFLGSAVALGDAKLKGASYDLFAGQDIYYPDGKNHLIWEKGAKLATIVTGEPENSCSYVGHDTFSLLFESDSDNAISVSHLLMGTYVVKETSASEGYLLDEEEHTFSLNYENDRTAMITIENTVSEVVMREKLRLTKLGNAVNDSRLYQLEGAGFRFYLLSGLRKSKDGTYDFENSYPVHKLINTAGETILVTSEEEENAAIAAGYSDPEVYSMITDVDGNAESLLFPYGKYIMHEYQVPEDRIPIKDQLIDIDHNDTIGFKEGHYYYLDDELSAKLRIFKKDADTEKTVLISGTAFQIYRMKEDGTTYKEIDLTGQPIPYTESYRNDDSEIVRTSVFFTNKDGYVMTHYTLEPGIYTIKEALFTSGEEEGNMTFHGVPEGYAYEQQKTVLVNLNSGSILWGDSGTNDESMVMDVDYSNKPVKGSVTIEKMGSSLVGTTTVSGGDGISFVYKEMPVEGTRFEVYADEDIATYDKQLDEEGNRTTYYKKDDLVGSLITDADGKAVLDGLPIGSYRVVEVSVPAPFVISPEPIRFEITYDTPLVTAKVDCSGNGEVVFHNDRQKQLIRIRKLEEGTEKAVEGAVFGLFAAEDIYGVNGNLLLEEGSLIRKGVSASDGIVDFGDDLPISTYRIEELGAKGYLTMEKKDADGIYERKGIVFETAYSGADKGEVLYTAVIHNKPTEVKISKVEASGGKELPGANMAIKDRNGNIVEEWVSTEEIHVVRGLVSNEFLKETDFDTSKQDGVVFYKLVETRPADGYATAEEIEFALINEHVYYWDFSVWKRLQEGIVTMKDETTKVQITKYDITNSKELPGATLILKDDEGNVVEQWVSEASPHYIEAKLIAGKNYTLTELIAPTGYLVAEPVTFQVIDDGSVWQKVEMYDALEIHIEDIHRRAELNLRDQTGEEPHYLMYGALALSISGLIWSGVQLYGVRQRKTRKILHPKRGKQHLY